MLNLWDLFIRIARSNILSIRTINARIVYNINYYSVFYSLIVYDVFEIVTEKQIF